MAAGKALEAPDYIKSVMQKVLLFLPDFFKLLTSFHQNQVGATLVLTLDLYVSFQNIRQCVCVCLLLNTSAMSVKIVVSVCHMFYNDYPIVFMALMLRLIVSFSSLSLSVQLDGEICSRSGCRKFRLNLL